MPGLFPLPRAENVASVPGQARKEPTIYLVAVMDWCPVAPIRLREDQGLRFVSPRYSRTKGIARSWKPIENSFRIDSQTAG